jgi:hypothetical protein
VDGAAGDADALAAAQALRRVVLLERPLDDVLFAAALTAEREHG